MKYKKNYIFAIEYTIEFKIYKETIQHSRWHEAIKQEIELIWKKI